MLRQIHDDIDREVNAAYGWPADLSEEEMLKMKRRRWFEELAGNVRWRRPEYQNPTGAAVEARAGDLGLKNTAAGPGKHPWPCSFPEQLSFVRVVLSDLGEASVEDVA